MGPGVGWGGGAAALRWSWCGLGGLSPGMVPGVGWGCLRPEAVPGVGCRASAPGMVPGTRSWGAAALGMVLECSCGTRSLSGGREGGQVWGANLQQWRPGRQHPTCLGALQGLDSRCRKHRCHPQPSPGLRALGFHRGHLALRQPGGRQAAGEACAHRVPAPARHGSCRSRAADEGWQGRELLLRRSRGSPPS